MYHRWTSQPAIQFVARNKKNGEQEPIYRNYFYFGYTFFHSPALVFICICCCFKRRWIQFTKMPGGRRGLVAPQNTFLENIIRRSNSQRKYIRFSIFFLFVHSLFFWIPLDSTITCIRLQNCKWVLWSKKKRKKKIQWICHQRWTKKIIKNSVKSPIELTLTANQRKVV